MTKPIAIYIHFPFCKKKCRYCDFLSFPPQGRTDSYMQALIQEIRTVPAPLFKNNDYMITSIFIGGGTPSLMTAGQLRALTDALYQYPVSRDAEITMEANPGTLTDALLETMADCGINRLSIGLQSADDMTLSYLGRIHTYSDFEKNYKAARAAGFKNINIDLMSALPAQSPEAYEDGLLKILSLSPEHISAYSLIIEEGTPFYTYYEENKSIGLTLPPLPTEDDERLMYHRTKAILRAFGYERYEISNYAKKGFECRHNKAYWTRQDYLGLGLGAASMIQNVRFSNTDDFNAYIKHFEQAHSVKSSAVSDIHTGREPLSVHAQMEEFMFLGLRLIAGVSVSEFAQLFGQDISSVYGRVLDRHLKDGTMIFDKNRGRLALSEHGLDVSNSIMADFLLD